MFKDPDCLDKFATILVGCSIAGAAAIVGVPPPGVAEALAGGGGLFAVLKGKRRTDAKAIRDELAKTLEREWKNWGEHSSHADANLRSSAFKSFETVIPHCAPLPAEMVGLNLNADDLANRVLETAILHLPVVYADTNKANAESHVPRTFLLTLTRRAYAHLLAQPDYVAQIAPDLWKGVLEQLDRMEGKIDVGNAKLDAVLAHLTASKEAKRLADAEITEAAIIALARSAVEGTQDLNAAWSDLQRLVEIAVRVQAEGRIASNHGDFVDEVLRRVADLSRDGGYSEAAEEIEQALAREEAESQARKIRLLDSQIELAVLGRDPEATAARLIRKADAEAGGRAALAALRNLAIEWTDRGRDKGLNFDLEVAIALGHVNMTRATTPDDRGAIGNDLGIALQTLGAREPGTARLEQAAMACTEALKAYARDRAPLDWAMTHNNLGNALYSLGEREHVTGRLEHAVTAYSEALKIYTRERTPKEWATAQNNLGNAFCTLAKRDSDTERLKQAIAAYSEALKVCTQERVPLVWAATKNNIGTALWILGVRESDTERLKQAIATYNEALKKYTRERTPQEWATAQNNIGNSHRALGALEPGTARLEQAVAAYTAALKEWTKDRVPLDWAGTQRNLSIVECAYFDKIGDAAHLDRAQSHLDGAREVFEQAQAGHYLSMTADQQAEIDRRRTP